MSKTIAQVKNYFRGIRSEQVELWALEQKYYSEYMELMPSGIRYDRDRVQSSPEDIMPAKFAALDKLDRQIKVAHERLLRRRTQAMELVDRLDDSEQRAVMKLYYLSLKESRGGIKRRRFYSWEEISELTDISISTVYRLHGQALKELSKFFKK